MQIYDCKLISFVKYVTFWFFTIHRILLLFPSLIGAVFTSSVSPVLPLLPKSEQKSFIKLLLDELSGAGSKTTLKQKNTDEEDEAHASTISAHTTADFVNAEDYTPYFLSLVITQQRQLQKNECIYDREDDVCRSLVKTITKFFLSYGMGLNVRCNSFYYLLCVMFLKIFERREGLIIKIIFCTTILSWCSWQSCSPRKMSNEWWTLFFVWWVFEVVENHPFSKPSRYIWCDWHSDNLFRGAYWLHLQ